MFYGCYSNDPLLASMVTATRWYLNKCLDVLGIVFIHIYEAHGCHVIAQYIVYLLFSYFTWKLSYLYNANTDSTE